VRGSHDRSGRGGDGDGGGGEVAAGMRGDGQEARPFFDPKHGQFGANFSGGTGPEAWNSGRRAPVAAVSPRKTEDDTSMYRHSGDCICLSPWRRMYPEDSGRLMPRELCLKSVNQR